MISRSAATFFFFFFASLVAWGCVDDFVGPEPDLDAILPDEGDIPWDVLSGKLAIVFTGETIDDVVLAILDAEAREIRPVMVGKHLGGPRLAPDGKSIAYTEIFTTGGGWEIWSIPVTESVLDCNLHGARECGSVLVSDGDASLLGPAWSSDGRLAYRRNARGEGAYSAYYYVDGAPAHSEGSPAGTIWDAHVTWAPDGTLVAALTVDGVASLYGIEPTTGDIVEILTLDDAFPRSPAVSPNGDLLAYESSGIWVASTDGSDGRFLVDGSQPVWSPDGAWIAFVAEFPDRGVYAVSPAGGEPILIARRAGEPSWQP